MYESRDFIVTVWKLMVGNSSCAMAQYLCEVCELSFACNSKLQRHMNSKNHSSFLESLSMQTDLTAGYASPGHDAINPRQSDGDFNSYEVFNDALLAINNPSDM